MEHGVVTMRSATAEVAPCITVRVRVCKRDRKWVRVWIRPGLRSDFGSSDLQTSFINFLIFCITWLRFCRFFQFTLRFFKFTCRAFPRHCNFQFTWIYTSIRIILIKTPQNPPLLILEESWSLSHARLVCTRDCGLGVSEVQWPGTCAS